MRRHPAFFPAFVDDEVFNRLDANRIVVNVERTCRFARRGTDAAGEFGEVVGAVQRVECLLPVAAIDEIIPVGNDVVDRAAGLAERNAAVHAARALLFRLVVLQRDHKFAIVMEA